MTARDLGLLGKGKHKAQPKLRMIANGSAPVNTVRAEQCASVAVDAADLLAETPHVRSEGDTPVRRRQLPRGTVRGKLAAIPSDISVSAFVHTNVAGIMPAVELESQVQKGNLMTATFPISRLPYVLEDPAVSWVELGEPIVVPRPEVTTAGVRPPSPALREVGDRTLHGGGSGVLVGIIDVQGFDFSHPDFLDATGKTRWERIWDQGGDARPSPQPGGSFNYGSEFRKSHLDAALAAAPALGVPAYEIERQSQLADSSHGTHVASIAAGNLGICREAKLAGVLIALPAEDLDPRKSFYDSTRIAHAVDYLLNVAHELGDIPIAINISLGTNGHAHDGSAAICRWIDSSLSVPGRAVCVAAGNAGQEVAAFEGDHGYVMGRIHTSGRVASRDLVTDIDWVVVGNGIADISENELEIWYSPQDRFTVSIRPPGMDWIGPIEPRQFIENQQLRDGSFVSIYNELYHPANGANYISIFLSPMLTPDGAVGVAAGTWTVRLHGQEVRDGSYHGWIERDDPRRIGRLGPREAWVFPSFFGTRSNVDNSSVSSLACGQRIVSVANLDDIRERINITSSQGPTRDGRSKPDVAAPGTDIVAARGFSTEDGEQWVSMSGTSMASPYVTGVTGLMLAVQPRLAAAQIEGILRRTSRPLPGGTFAWVTDAGFGRIDPAACLHEAARLLEREDRTP